MRTFLTMAEPRRREEGCCREEAIRDLLTRHGDKRFTIVDVDERPTMTYLIEQVRARCAKRSTLVAGLAITHPVILGAIRDETILRGEGRLNAYAKRPGSTLMRREKAIQRENFSRSIWDR
jgi:hypothetical protein